MAYPQQTFATIDDLLNYVNTYIVANGVQEITGPIHNNVENSLANFIVYYTLNSSKVSVVASGGSVVLPTPMTMFINTTPSAISWIDDVQNEYYIINATGNNIPLLSGFSYVDPFLTVQTIIPSRTVIHIAKAINGSWVQVNNSTNTSPGILPPQSGHNGQVLFTNGTSAFWGDQFLQLPGSDANWINGTTWINGSSYVNGNFNSPHFSIFSNNIAGRYLLQNQSPPEWQYMTNGFQVLLPGFNAPLMGENLFLIFKGTP